MEADKIVNKRAEERDRDYGGFSAAMIKTAKIASELCNKIITAEDAYKVLMALKLARLAHSAKFDSFVDLIGYTEGMYNYLQEKQQAVHDQQNIIAADTPIEETFSCGRCYGTGLINKGDIGDITCPRCKGSGKVILTAKPA